MSWQHNNFNPKSGHTLYRPRNPEKYIGDVDKIISRSSYESKFYRWCDNNENVIKWITEPFHITYIDIDYKCGGTKQRKYFPDVLFQCKTSQGIETYLVEIKPYKETQPPKQNKRKNKKTQLYEQRTWNTNSRKWAAAKNFCKQKGWHFNIVTERELF